MVKPPRHQWILTLLIGALFSGCAGSQPARFYSLHPLQGLPERKEPGRNQIIAVGPIRFPDYLNRPEIVTRTAQNRMNLSEFHLWAGNLPEDFATALIDNLSALLSREGIILVPNRVRPGVVDYQLVMEVLHFEGPLGGDVSLVTRWTIVKTKDKQWLFVQSSSISEPSGGPGYDAFVGAQSRALERLSREIADTIKALPKTGT